MISRGECSITDEYLLGLGEDHNTIGVLMGLKLLYQDLELYKAEYKSNLEADYNLKVLQKKNEELEQFNYMASHDLKEPLRNIKNFSQLLSANFQKLSDEKISEYLSYIDKASGRMSDLLQSLLGYTTAGADLQIANVEVGILLEELVQDMSSIIEGKDVRIIISDMPSVYADKNCLRLVFQNLMTNAIKFRKKGESVEVDISCKLNLNEVVFCVKDNGLGIAPEFHDRIFELMSRLHTKSEIDGSGIGLSICKKLILMHNGNIWLESELNKGSRFYFSIPVIV